MKSREQEKFFSALHRYIRRVVAEIPSGELPQNMTEKSDSSDDMISALKGIIGDMVEDAVREHSHSTSPPPHILRG